MFYLISLAVNPARWRHVFENKYSGQSRIFDHWWKQILMILRTTITVKYITILNLYWITLATGMWDISARHSLDNTWKTHICSELMFWDKSQ